MPAEHVRQLDAPNTELNEPAVQERQVEENAVGEKKPGVQLTHIEAVLTLNVPALQTGHADAPVELKPPAMHGRQLERLAVGP